MIFYTDGSCTNNGHYPNIGGYGIVAFDDKESCVIDAWSAQEKNSTNNREEIKALEKEGTQVLVLDHHLKSDDIEELDYGIIVNNQTSKNVKDAGPIAIEREDHVEVTCKIKLPTIPEAYCDVIYRVYGDGTIGVTLGYDPVAELHDMPEFGMMFKMDADFDHVKWYGMGPEENYADRNKGAKLGLWENKVLDNVAQYLSPQECGNKTGVRYALVTDRAGKGMLFAGDRMYFSALPYTPHEMENAAHPHELQERCSCGDIRLKFFGVFSTCNACTASARTSSPFFLNHSIVSGASSLI